MEMAFWVVSFMLLLVPIYLFFFYDYFVSVADIHFERLDTSIIYEDDDIITNSYRLDIIIIHA